MARRKAEPPVSDQTLAEVVSQCFTDVCRTLGKAPVGGNTIHYRNRCRSKGIDYSHFNPTHNSRGKPSRHKLPVEHHLRVYEAYSRRISAKLLKRCMLEVGIKHECVECGLTNEWMGRKLVLEVDHINEMYWDNRKENLQFLCPNCHSTK